MKKLVIFSLFLALAFVNVFNANAQNKAKLNVSGQVFSVATAGEKATETVPFAVIILPEINVSVSSDADGVFSIPNMNPGQYKVSIQSLGYQTLETTMNVVANKENRFEYTLVEANFRMEEIVVTAQVSKAGSATSSIINKAAMEHLQTTSLADVMSLMPGAVQQKADLQGVNTPSIRGGASLGTAVIMDGSPMSNNANLQTMGASMGNASTGTGAVGSTGGVDLRTITTDNIESIEVIRGVAPVEYGDITAGAIIVNSKAGYQPLTIKLSTNPNVYSASATQGFALGKKAGNINYGVDYAYSVDEPRENYDYYQRVTGRVGYTNTFGKFYTNSSLSFLWTKDMAEPNADDPDDVQCSHARDLGFRFAHNGSYNANAGFFKSLQYNVSFGYTNRESYFFDEATNADVPYSYSKVDGSVISSYANGHVYDVEGNELTHYTQEMDKMKAWMLPGTYQYSYNVYGKELNTYAKVKANFAGDWGRTNHRLVVGIDFKSDGNVGEGKVFDIDNPPFRSVGYEFQTQRERSYKDIPFVNQFGAFVQETFTMDIAKRKLEIVAGVRYDNTFDFGGAFSPRINASYELVPNVLSVHGAYGITRKAPTLAYLYPDNAYFDIINYNNSLALDADDPHRMQLVTTRVFDVHNEDLEMLRQDKYEVGLTANIGKMTFSVVGYQEECLNGYNFENTLNTIKLIDFVKYDWDGKKVNANNVPVLEESQRNNYFLQYTQATNNDVYKRTGLEFVFNFGRIDAIRTTFQVDGQIYTAKSWNKGLTFFNYLGADAANDYSKYPDMGVYSTKDVDGVHYSENFSTNFIATHNIPQIGLVITATAHINWRTKAWMNYAENDIIPLQYISRQDGKLYDFNQAWANPEHEMYSTMRYLMRDNEVSPTRREHNRVYPPYVNINLNITKQFGDYMDVSFFAQNVFRSSPLYESSKTPGSYTRLNTNKFFFGLQLNAKIN